MAFNLGLVSKPTNKITTIQEVIDAKLTFGIVTSKQGETKYGNNNKYLDFFQRYGNVIQIPGNSTKEFVNSIPFDILGLLGGSDLDTKRYGEPPLTSTYKPNNDMEWFDTQVLPSLIAKGMPTIGICRGFQTLVVEAGGALDQQIPQNFSNPRGETTDELIFLKNKDYLYPQLPLAWRNPYPTEKLKKGTFYKVNSIHHQGVQGYYDNTGNIFFPKLSPNCVPLAYNEEYGNLEAMCYKNAPVVGFQWHPEELANPAYAEMWIMHLAEIAINRRNKQNLN